MQLHREGAVLHKDAAGPCCEPPTASNTSEFRLYMACIQTLQELDTELKSVSIQDTMCVALQEPFIFQRTAVCFRTMYVDFMCSGLYMSLQLITTSNVYLFFHTAKVKASHSHVATAAPHVEGP